MVLIQWLIDYCDAVVCANCTYSSSRFTLVKMAWAFWSESKLFCSLLQAVLQSLVIQIHELSSYYLTYNNHIFQFQKSLSSCLILMACERSSRCDVVEEDGNVKTSVTFLFDDCHSSDRGRGASVCTINSVSLSWSQISHRRSVVYLSVIVIVDFIIIAKPFLPTRRYASADLCDSDVSVRPSGRPSVTRRYCA